MLSGCDAYNNTIKQEAEKDLEICHSKLKIVLLELFISSLGVKEVTFTSNGAEVLIDNGIGIDEQMIESEFSKIIEKAIQ